MPLKDPEARRRYHAEYSRERWYPANREKHKAAVAQYNRKRCAENRRRLCEFKAGSPCVDCGGVFLPDAMEFDHVDGGKVANISTMAGRYSWGQIEAEIAKCELVCANCHRARTAVRRAGGGPHEPHKLV